MIPKPSLLYTSIGLTGLLIYGCLASDPKSVVDQIDADQDARRAVVRSAPRHIDPRILEARAFGEAPMLASMVAAGELPPVADRLPENPLVVRPIEEIGRYGGKLRRVLTGDIVQTTGVFKTLSESLTGFSRPLPDSIEVALAERFWFEDEHRTAYFKLRKGVRWSDGVPLTVDDILFWYYDMTVDSDARNDPVIPGNWLVDGKPVKMEKVDDLTIKVTSPKPLGRILHATSMDVIAMPKHRLAHLHPRYNPQATYETFRDSTTNAQKVLNPGFPRLSAWVPVEWHRGQRVLYRRNPYYYKVDTAGNQLPYADFLEFTVVQDSQVILLKFMNGEFDLFGRYSQIDMVPTLRAEEQKGKFKLRVTGPERGVALYLNWDGPKPALREAFRNLKTRQALSYAINREEINQIVCHGLLDISGYSLLPSSPYFTDEAYRKYSQYDPELANRLLDEAGYLDTDGDGFRELSDGSRFDILIDVRVTPNSDLQMCELIADHWREIGVNGILNPLLRDLLYPRRNNGEFDIHVWPLEGPADPLGYMNDWGIMSGNGPFWHKKAMETGQAWFWEATESVKAAMTTVDPAELRHHMGRIRDLHSDNVPVIVVGANYHVWGANTRLGNVPMQNTAADVHRGWGRPVFHEQIFIRE
jgi:peptide/nickel transport system substrate-binding protein